MTDDHPFPDELAWRDDGHVSDTAVTALADGQREVVPLEAYAHVQSCPLCGERLGEAALLASLVDEALRPEATPAQAPAAALVPLPQTDTLPAAEASADNGAGELAGPIPSGRRLPLPVPALAAALVVAAVGAAPTLIELAPRLPALLASWAGRVPVLVRTLATLLRTLLAGDGTAVTVAWTGAGLVLLMVGVLITRLMPLQTQGERHE